MKMINQNGEEVFEETLYAEYMPYNYEDDRDSAIALLCGFLGVKIVKTNATKHGTTELVLVREDD